LTFEQSRDACDDDANGSSEVNNNSLSIALKRHLVWNMVLIRTLDCSKDEEHLMDSDFCFLAVSHFMLLFLLLLLLLLLLKCSENRVVDKTQLKL